MLHDDLQAFAGALAGDSSKLAPRVRSGQLTAGQQIGVYVNNVAATLTDALSSVYPVVEKLVSPGFFGFAASEYLRGHMPDRANLHDFGASFPEFLKSFMPVQSLPYLPDVARLEWAWHCAFHAENPSSPDPEHILGVPANEWPQLRLLLQPGTQLVASPYPIVRIFEVNQDDFSGDLSVSLDEPGVTALVIRRHLTVRVETLGHGEAELLAALQRGAILSDALDWAIRAQPDFELEPVFARHVQAGTFSAFRRPLEI